MDRWIFYKKNFEDFVEKKSNILIISASSKEINVLKELGYYNFSITFHDSNEKEKLIELGFEENKNLFKADIRNLPFENNAFDYVITNATIHHVDIPHKAVTEMYRISSKGTLIIESNDSIVMQLATKMKLAEEFEISSVEGNTGGSSPGLATALELRSNIDYRARGIIHSTATGSEAERWFAGVPYTGGSITINKATLKSMRRGIDELSTVLTSHKDSILAFVESEIDELAIEHFCKVNENVLEIDTDLYFKAQAKGAYYSIRALQQFLHGNKNLQYKHRCVSRF
mgnify:CR=1 FL=1